MKNERLKKIKFKIFLLINSFFCLFPYRYCLDLDPYQSSAWIRIFNEFFQIPDPFQHEIDLQH